VELIASTRPGHTDQLALASQAGTLSALNPLEHAGWDSLLSSHSASSFFHTTAWCNVLHQSYAHRPLYLSRVAEDRLIGLLPLMEVASPWTGRRGVSLPFTDVCPALTAAASGVEELFELAKQQGRRLGWSYLEFRGSRPPWPGAFPSLSFWDHIVELDAGPEAVFKHFDSALRRGIRKAEAAGLKVEFNNNLDAIRSYFSLHCGTRRRHGVPPQPLSFFENIARFVFAAGQGFVATARFGQRPAAAAVFFHWRNQAIYKFGASDYRLQHLRPNNLVMWAAIQKFAAEGFKQLDLGRTSLANEGLRRFKSGFGAREHRIDYYRYDLRHQTFVQDADRAEGRLNQLFRRLPPPLFRLAGRLLYPHLS
jgi:CelD/BcsL family acetyltransferase involved in cellulose biosynthesis